VNPPCIYRGALALTALALAGCGGKYAGLTRDQARQAAFEAISGKHKVNPTPVDEGRNRGARSSERNHARKRVREEPMQGRVPSSGSHEEEPTGEPDSGGHQMAALIRALSGTRSLEEFAHN
jgi:hypothetical protein